MAVDRLERPSAYLLELVARADAAAMRLRGAPGHSLALLGEQARRDYALLSARLDASPLEPATAAAVDECLARGEAVVQPPAGAPGKGPSRGWAGVLKLEAVPTQDVAAVEYANLLAAAEAEPQFAPRIFVEPLQVLADLHRLVTRYLVSPEVIGRPRRTDQAIHDGAQGRVIYHASKPEVIPGQLEQLGRWLASDSAAQHALVVAGVVQERLLEWQPFEAANGRVARAASRIVLRARGLDAFGVAVPERLLSADVGGYYGEVAATTRRRGDLGPWLERYGEALVDSLEQAADVARPGAPVEPPARARAAVQALPTGRTVNVAEYAARAGVDRQQARADLAILVQAGLLGREPGTRGLRYRRR